MINLKKMTITFKDEDLDVYDFIKSERSPSKFIISTMRTLMQNPGTRPTLESRLAKLLLGDVNFINNVGKVLLDKNIGTPNVVDSSVHSYEENNIGDSIEQFDEF